MTALSFHKLLAPLPAPPLQPDALYFVKDGSSVRAYITDDAGTPLPFGGGGEPYVHNQAQAAAQWVVNHNRGYRPSSVAVLSVGGVEVDAAVTHVSVNQLTVDFAVPYAGQVLVA
jgi:hypothetical protein